MSYGKQSRFLRNINSKDLNVFTVVKIKIKGLRDLFLDGYGKFISANPHGGESVVLLVLVKRHLVSEKK